MRPEITDSAGSVEYRLLDDRSAEICRCHISVNLYTKSWDIVSWFTAEGYKNKGYGKAALKCLLRYCLDHYGMPPSITYIWNGTNQYVMDWLEKHFDAVCACPISVQKTQPGDDWSSHIYKLDRDKVLTYFGLSGERTDMEKHFLKITFTCKDNETGSGPVAVEVPAGMGRAEIKEALESCKKALDEDPSFYDRTPQALMDYACSEHGWQWHYMTFDEIMGLGEQKAEEVEL